MNKARPVAEPRAAYFPQLDTLRALAIGFVLLEHWLNPVAKALGIHGGYGVWLFFTLSGYLITGILLRYRDAVEGGRSTLGEVLRIFFARRFLRILPVYYLFLLFAALAGRMDAESAPWHLAYLSNFYFWQRGEFVAMGHLWSLSVEEQFYMVWPVVIILVARLRLPVVLVGAVISAVVFRLVSITLDWGLASYVFPFAALDTLGLGALLAWVERNPLSRIRLAMTPARIAALAALPFIGFAPDPVFTLLAPLIVGLVSVWLIAACVRGIGGLPGRVMSFGPFQYLGRISYGLYLYHALATWLVLDVAGPSIIDGYYRNMLVVAGLNGAVLLMIATASWYLFEQPINRVKRHFRLRDRSGVPAAATTASPTG